MLGDQPLLTYICENKDGIRCAVCPDPITYQDVHFILFKNDPSHQSLPLHRQCARAALEKFILNRERKQREAGQ